MKKLFSYKNKKQRGVALVFTLGILGLLTVVALGFASTALINRKVAENCANISYTQTIARSIALPRAMFAVRNITSLEQFYSTSTDPKTYDWLWKLDTSLHGVQLFKYQYTAVVDSTTNAVDWVYVRDSNDNNRILGRYAYVVIPDKGRLDPSVNINDIDSKGIIGLSEKEVGVNDPAWSTALKAAIDASPNYRWTTFWEISNRLSITSPHPQNWIDFFTKGINIGQVKSPETYWVDSTTNPNIKDKDEFYLRFNLSRSTTDWKAMTAEKLVGEGSTATDETKITDPLYLYNSIDFIPWLKNWTRSHDDWTSTAMKKQIAANIIQYNTPNPNTVDAGGVAFETVSDQMGKDWATEANAPSYAGVGRHASLNEIGFGLKVTAEVISVQSSVEPEVWTYTPKYTFTVNWGAELINMFGPPDSKSIVRLPQVSVEADVKHFVDSVDPNTTNIDEIVADETLPKKTFKTSDRNTYDGAIAFPEFRIDFAVSDWLSNIAYTSKDKFWQTGLQLKSITLPPIILNGSDKSSDILNHMEVMQVRFKPGNAILYHGEYDLLDFKTQRDFAKLSALNASDFTDTTTLKAKDTCHYWMSFEAKDPRVNHYPSDWTITKIARTEVMDPSAANLYPGTIVNSSHNDEHKNSTVTSAAFAEEDSAVTDPAYQSNGTEATRFSSSFIKHEPMVSSWELGLISRAEAWKTLNLSKKDLSAAKTYAYDKGDAALLDQIKLNENDDRLKYGKVNINTNIHQVLEALLDPAKLIYKKDLYKAVGNDLLATGTSESAYPPITKISTNPATPHLNCLICSILACTKIYPFMNRADLLVDPANASELPGYTGSGLGDGSSGPLKDMQALLKVGTSKVEKEQIISKIMPLLKTEPLDMVYVIVLAQTIRDIGGTPAYIDWNGDGDYSDTFNDLSSFDLAAMKKAGYVRTGEITSSVSSVSVQETYNTTDTHIGTYEIGADKITSEAKLIAVLVQDPVTRKWRIARYQYVE